MTRRNLVVLAVVLAATAPQARVPLDEILDRFYDARGGLQNLKAIESARIVGKYVMTGMSELPVRMEWRRPDRLRLEIGTPGDETVEAYDGETAWIILPGAGVAQEASGDQAESIRRQADLMDGPLVDWQAKGNLVRYLGQDELDGVSVNKLGLLESDGTQTTVFLDASSFLAIRHRGSAHGTQGAVEVFLEDYRDVGGLMIAHTIKTELIDVGLTQWFRIEAVEFNVDIPDARFVLPGRRASP